MSKRIVAITACPTGLPIPFMAAEALEEEAKTWLLDQKSKLAALLVLKRTDC